MATANDWASAAIEGIAAQLAAADHFDLAGRLTPGSDVATLLSLAEEAEQRGDLTSWDALCHLAVFLDPRESDVDPEYRAAWLAALTGEEEVR